MFLSMNIFHELYFLYELTLSNSGNFLYFAFVCASMFLVMVVVILQIFLQLVVFRKLYKIQKLWLPHSFKLLDRRYFSKQCSSPCISVCKNVIQIFIILYVYEVYIINILQTHLVILLFCIKQVSVSIFMIVLKPLCILLKSGRSRVNGPLKKLSCYS